MESRERPAGWGTARVSAGLSRRVFINRMAGLATLTVLGASCGAVAGTPSIGGSSRTPRSRATEQGAVSIGMLGGGTIPDDVEAFRQGLRDHDWVVGQNITIVFRDVRGDLERQPSEVADMLAQGVRLIVSAGPSATTAIMKVDPSIPIVIAGGGDPLAAGFITSYAQPGGRVTGVVSAEGFDAKRVEILKEIVPSARRLAFITNLGIAGQKARAAVTESTAQQLGMQSRVFDARSLSDIETAFERARGWGADVVVPSTNNPMANARAHVLALVSRNRLPAVYGKVDWARAGGLVGYGPNFRAVYRRAAAYVDKILRGAAPADLPVERSSAFELVVNRRALADLSLTVPPAVAPLVTEWVD